MTQKHIDSEKIIDFLQKKLSSMRSGRVNASILDNILVDAYGSKMKISEIASITTPEPAQLLITPFDKSLVSGVEKGIRDSDLGASVNNDGAGIRLVFPPLTEEAKKKRVKDVYAYLEEAKIVARNIRHDVLKTFKQQKENGEISEDELKKVENEVQNEINSINKALEDISKLKEAEIMKV